MTKFLKRIFQLLIALIVILTIAAVGIVNFVNPSQFKDIIESEVLAKTGFVLNVEGPIRWRWYPILSLEFDNIAVQNLQPFSGQLLAAKMIQAECKLLPVFLGKIALTVKFKGLDLALIRNAKGQGNWENLNPKSTEPNKVVPSNKNSEKSSVPTVIVSGIILENAQITFNDASKNSQFVFTEVNLSLDNAYKGLLGIGTPLIVNFELAYNNQTLGNIFLNTDWSLVKEKEQISLKKIAFKFKHPDGVTNLITGNAEIEGFSKPNISGNLQGSALQFRNIKVDQIRATIKAEGGIINLDPINIQIAKSQQKATLKLDTRGNSPKVYFTQEAADFEINDMLALFGKKNKISGKTRLSMNIMATGSSMRELQNSLSGKANIQITNGKFYGMDLVTLLKNAQGSVHALINALTHKLSFDSLSVINSELTKWKADPDSNAVTPFNSLKATANITNGIINTRDLSIQQSEYSITGGGTINPGANTIQFQTALQLKKNLYPADDKAGAFLFRTPLYVQIQGSLNDPKIRPELTTYTNHALDYAKKELVEKVIQKTIGKAIEKATGGSGVQDTLENALGNILKPKN